MGSSINPDLAPGVSHVTIGKTAATCFSGLSQAPPSSSTQAAASPTRERLAGANGIVASSDDNFSVDNSGIIVGRLRHRIPAQATLTVTNSGSIHRRRSGTIFKFGTGELKDHQFRPIECEFICGHRNGAEWRAHAGEFRNNSEQCRSPIFRSSTTVERRPTLRIPARSWVTSQFGDGADTFTNFMKVRPQIIKSGTVTGEIDLGGGADIFNGGSQARSCARRRRDATSSISAAATIRSLRLSSCLYANNTDADVVDGGKGIDTYDASEATSAGHRQSRLGDLWRRSRRPDFGLDGEGRGSQHRSYYRFRECDRRRRR